MFCYLKVLDTGKQARIGLLNLNNIGIALQHRKVSSAIRQRLEPDARMAKRCTTVGDFGNFVYVDWLVIYGNDDGVNFGDYFNFMDLAEVKVYGVFFYMVVLSFGDIGGLLLHGDGHISWVENCLIILMMLPVVSAQEREDSSQRMDFGDLVLCIIAVVVFLLGSAKWIRHLHVCLRHVNHLPPQPAH